MIGYIIMFFILFKFGSNHELAFPVTTDLDQENDKILAAIDDIFIALKVDKNFKNFKNVAEYISIHRYIQDAVRNRNNKYNEMYNQSKIIEDHKTAYYISNINKALREMINDYRITNTDLYFDNNKHSSAPAASDDILTDFINLAKHFHINLNMNKNTKTGNDTGIAKYVETRRIYGGEVAEIGNWPFIVSIHIASRFACAGSIIREDLVLSAASSFNRFYKEKPTKEIKTNIWIRAGSDSIYSGGEMVRAVRLHFHFQYDPKEQTDNMVILQLKVKLLYKIGLIQPIRCAKKGTKYKNVHIAGWGNKQYETTAVPASPEFVRMTEQPSIRARRYRYRRNGLIVDDRRLQHSVLDKYDMDICKYGYSNRTITTKNFCAGSLLRGSGACKYDIGGPGVIRNVLHAVISFGPSRCGITGAPTVFTKVYRYKKWFKKIFCNVVKTNDTVDDSGEMEALAMLGPGGRKVRRYPFVASVFVKDKYVCTGAIIRRDMVITVGSCLKPFDFLDKTKRRSPFITNVFVRVGSDLYPSGKLIPVIDFHFHYNFDHKTLAFNLVLLVLKTKINFVKGQIAGIRVSNSTRLKFKYQQVPVVGWGADCPATKTAPRNEPGLLLRSVLLNRTYYEDCRKHYILNKNTTFVMTSVHHCLAPGGWGGDSLGNLVLVKNKLFGLVNVDCSRRSPNSPVVFIKAAVFSWWINSMMCQYKERFDPSDASKISDYGSIENVSSVEMLITIGRKIHCKSYKGATLNCTSINITTYYCERRDGKRLPHGTPIVCDDIDDDYKVKCTTASIREMDRYDIARSLVNWPHSSTHNGAIYYCEPDSRNTSVRSCNYTNVGLTCYETNCTESIIDRVIFCDYRNCTAWAGPTGLKSCRFRERYCLDLNRRPTHCPGKVLRRCYYVENEGYVCKKRECHNSEVDGSVWSHRVVTQCDFTIDCQDNKMAWYRNCSEAKRKRCITLTHDLNACIKQKCGYFFRGADAFCEGYWEEPYCFDIQREHFACPEYKMRNSWTKCTNLENYIYDEAIMCAEEWCTLAHLLNMSDFNFCRARNYCYTTKGQTQGHSEERVNITFNCPKEGENCRKVAVDEYEYQLKSDSNESATYNYKIICVKSVCTEKHNVAVHCTSKTSVYCHNNHGTVECPPLDTVDDNYNVLALRSRVDDANFHSDDDVRLTTFATSIYTQNNAPSFKARADVDDYADDDPRNDMELVKYASPRQTQTNVPSLQTRGNVDDDSLNKDVSIREIPINVPALRAQPDDGNDAAYVLDKDDDALLDSYEETQLRENKDDFV
ncbi:uncharacterized protein [Choristoneura fumiferana]|uniref:uncharacterized protein n=1 Tax=Choristoneura fumiferana TaxID=7141 RepID=UPI003D15EAAB